jgi:sulfonate transport system substrate-binding protein
MNRLETFIVTAGLGLVLTLSMIVFWPKEIQKIVDLRIVRLGTIGQSVSYAPFYVAVKQGKFEEVFSQYGYKIEYKTFTSADDAIHALTTDQIDIVYSAELAPVILAKAQRAQVFIAGVTSTYLEEIMVPMVSPIKTIEEIRSRKIIVRPGSSNHFNLRKCLNAIGISPDDFAIADMDIHDSIAAIKNEEVDGWATASPYVELAELSHYARTLPKGEAKAYSILIVREAFKQLKAKAFIDLLNVMDEAKAWIPFNEITAVTITADTMNMPVEVIKKAFFRHNWGIKLDEAAINIMQPIADYMREQHMIDDPVDIRGTLVKTNLD